MNERELEIRRRHELWVFHGAADSPGGQCHRDREWLLAELDRLRSEQAEMVKALRGLQEKWRRWHKDAVWSPDVSDCAHDLTALIARCTTGAAGETPSKETAHE